ncbi:hypothetical protein ACWD4O_45110 [Streptomyces sp. NPDC002623]
MLVDVEAGRVVDVLPYRTSETFAAWLTEHPGAEIVWRRPRPSPRCRPLGPPPPAVHAPPRVRLGKGRR